MYICTCTKKLSVTMEFVDVEIVMIYLLSTTYICYCHVMYLLEYTGMLQPAYNLYTCNTYKIDDIQGLSQRYNVSRGAFQTI